MKIITLVTFTNSSYQSMVKYVLHALIWKMPRKKHYNTEESCTETMQHYGF